MWKMCEVRAAPLCGTLGEFVKPSSILHVALQLKSGTQNHHFLDLRANGEFFNIEISLRPRCVR